MHQYLVLLIRAVYLLTLIKFVDQNLVQNWKPFKPKVFSKVDLSVGTLRKDKETQKKTVTEIITA